MEYSRASRFMEDLKNFDISGRRLDQDDWLPESAKNGIKSREEENLPKRVLKGRNQSNNDRKEVEKQLLTSILNTFMQTHLWKSNSSGPGAKSPAELLFGRQMRALLEATLPATPSGPGNKKSENWYNQHHGAKNPSFKTGDHGYMLVFNENYGSWLPGVAEPRNGDVVWC